MILFGAYPFTVFIANFFTPTLDVKYEVKHYHHPAFINPDTGQLIIDEMRNPKNDEPLPCVKYLIQPGHKIGFSMYFGDESIELSLDPGNKDKPMHPYSIRVGAKAKCKLTVGTNNITPVETSQPGRSNGPDDDGFLCGAVWGLNPGDPTTESWKLTIKKYTFDPEEDNVVIGPDPPA